MPALKIQEKFQNCPVNPNYSSFEVFLLSKG